MTDDELIEAWKNGELVVVRPDAEAQAKLFAALDDSYAGPKLIEPYTFDDIGNGIHP
jgi:hypothetical protein